MGDEKRRFTRIIISLNGELTVRDQLFNFNEISNLSIGGCLLPVDQDLEEGTEVGLNIYLGDAENEPVIQIKGRVIRLLKNELAVRFTHIDPDSLFHLQNVVRYNAEDADAIEQEIKDHPGIK